MIHPRWLAKLIADRFGYFWLECPNCHRPFAGFETGEYWVGMDSLGRWFRTKAPPPFYTAADCPQRWLSCCQDCNKWLAVDWYPVPWVLGSTFPFRLEDSNEPIKRLKS